MAPPGRVRAQWYAAAVASPTVAFNSRVYPYTAAKNIFLAQTIPLDLTQQACTSPARQIVIHRLHGPTQGYPLRAGKARDGHVLQLDQTDQGLLIHVGRQPVAFGQGLLQGLGEQRLVGCVQTGPKSRVGHPR